MLGVFHLGYFTCCAASLHLPINITCVQDEEMLIGTNLDLSGLYTTHSYFSCLSKTVVTVPCILCVSLHLSTMPSIMYASKIAYYERQERDGGLCRVLWRVRPGNDPNYLCPPPIGQNSVKRPPNLARGIGACSVPVCQEEEMVWETLSIMSAYPITKQFYFPSNMYTEDNTKQ